MAKKKKRTQKVGTTRLGFRKINGKRRKVTIKKVSRKKYKVTVVGKKRRAKRRTKRRGRRR